MLWDAFLARLPNERTTPAERAHADGIVVTADSPEAFEEMLWLAFFGRLHDPHASAVLDDATDCPEFERLFADHMSTLLGVPRDWTSAVEGTRVYVCVEQED